MKQKAVIYSLDIYKEQANRDKEQIHLIDF